MRIYGMNEDMAETQLPEVKREFCGYGNEYSDSEKTRNFFSLPAE
jgi:hypothetical protein